MRFLRVSCGELKMTTWKTSKVWKYFELEWNGKSCVNCVMSDWFTITLQRCVIIFNTGIYALAWRLAKDNKCKRQHTLTLKALSHRTLSHSRCLFLEMKTRVGGGAGFPGSFRNCLLVVISLRARDFSSCRAHFFQVQNRL